MSDEKKYTFHLRHGNDMPGTRSNGEHGRVEFYLYAMPEKEGGHVWDDIVNGIFWRDFGITAIMDSNKPTPSSFGWSLGYIQKYMVEIQDATNMLCTLSKIEKGMDKITKQFGCSQSFGEYVCRVATVLKAKVAFAREAKYSDEKWFVRDPGDARWSVDEEVAKVWKACRKYRGLPTGDEQEQVKEEAIA